VVDGPAACIVTGASSGLGRATALRLAEEGHRVALIARSPGDLDAVAEDVRRAGGEPLTLPCDLADAAAAHAAIESAASAWGGIDALVNSAATDVPGIAEEISVADWDRVIAVNLRGPFVLSRAAFAHMRRGGGGTIINISSVAGMRGWAGASAYCASKFALTGLTQSLAAEGREHGIRVCVLYPGAMDTSWGTWASEERAANEESEAPQPEKSLPAGDVAALIAWMITAPSGMVLNQVTVTPLLEQGWP
jgi:NAD(P)-dependent dehydrogenase (short-subunit alcohol dehydrogenase family)